MPLLKTSPTVLPGFVFAINAASTLHTARCFLIISSEGFIKLTILVIESISPFS